MPRGARKRESWKAFVVTVRETRGEPSVWGSVRLASVVGRDGLPFSPRIVWEGEVARLADQSTMTAEEAAEYAAAALRNAYPGLF